MTKKQFAGTVRAHEIANNIHPQASKQASKQRIAPPI